MPLPTQYDWTTFDEAHRSECSRLVERLFGDDKDKVDLNKEVSPQLRDLLRATASEALNQSFQLGKYGNMWHADSVVSSVLKDLSPNEKRPGSLPSIVNAPGGTNTIDRLGWLEKNDEGMWKLLAVQLLRVLERRKKKLPGTTRITKADGDRVRIESLPANLEDHHSLAEESAHEILLAFKEMRDKFESERAKLVLDVYAFDILGICTSATLFTDPTTRDKPRIDMRWNPTSIKELLDRNSFTTTNSEVKSLMAEIKKAVASMWRA